jgi:hypothetical protein
MRLATLLDVRGQVTYCWLLSLASGKTWDVKIRRATDTKVIDCGLIILCSHVNLMWGRTPFDFLGRRCWSSCYPSLARSRNNQISNICPVLDNDTISVYLCDVVRDWCHRQVSRMLKVQLTAVRVEEL